MKNMFLNPAKNTGMCEERKYYPKHNEAQRTWYQVWYNDECEVLRKKCMLLKNSPDNTSDKQYQEYAEQINIYKKLVSKTKKCTLISFIKRSEI